jgi:peptide/nickel transport system permease protein
MTLYIIRRLLWAVLVVNIVVFITFLVFFKLPNGDPALRFAGKSPTTQNLEIIRQRLHLDKPFYVEYFEPFIAAFALATSPWSPADLSGW